MPEVLLSEKVELHCGDSLSFLRETPDNWFDSIVTDPPYALVSIGKRFGADGSAPVKVPDGGSGAYARASAGFMGKKWDTGETAFAVEFWMHCLRVLKPGGHVVAFGGTRTYHRLAVAIEDAGFEIRDMISWTYGSGFPKSHDVSKGLDKARKDDAHWLVVGQWLRSQRESKGLRQKEVAAMWPSVTGGLTGCVANWELGLSCPKWDQWLQLKSFIGFPDDMDAEVWRLNGRKGMPAASWDEREVIAEGKPKGKSKGIYGDFAVDEYNYTAPATDAAREWQGWGTALKPAVEPICLARKPLIGTVAENVLRYGVGALNVDGCRVGTADELRAGAGGLWSHYRDGEASAERRYQNEGSTNFALKPGPRGGAPEGRWPANLVHDGSEEVLAAFPAEAGAFAPVRGTESSNAVTNVYGARERTAAVHHGDSGSAARFFYTAKADADDRLGSKHPTVKPVDLMQWLVRLVTPKGGLVLDPFAGTGTTGEACFREGMRCMLVEREEEYQADIRRRMSLVLGGPEERRRESIKAKMKDQPIDMGPLFNTTA